MDRSEISVVQVGSPQTRYEALASGQVDVAALMEPWSTLAEVNGFNRVIEAFYYGSDIVSDAMDSASYAELTRQVPAACPPLNPDSRRTPARLPEARATRQVPGRTKDDGARISRLHEDHATIAKALKQINALANGHDAQAMNQAIRWVTTKDAHASHIIEVVAEYFLTQKLKPVVAGATGYQAYVKKLADHHAVMVAAMKTKQKADNATAEAPHHAIDAWAKHYK